MRSSSYLLFKNVTVRPYYLMFKKDKFITSNPFYQSGYSPFMMDILLPELVSKGYFGNIKFISCSLNKNEKGTPNYSSTVNFATLTYLKNYSENKLHIVIKTQLLNPKEREFRDCDQMFKNEITMYNVILPKIGADKTNLFPKLFYSFTTDGSDIIKDILLLENLSQNDFQNAKDFFLDFKHLSLAIRKLALFHSLSYTHKMTNYDSFKSMVEGLNEAWFTNKLSRNIKAQSLSAIRRGIEPLIDQNYEKDTLVKFLNSFEDLFEVVAHLKATEEPFGVVCHGDFVQNNMCFKYIDNTPVDFRMFDLQNSSYSTPALDLSTFLYTNTNKKTRDRYWDHFLSIYWHEFISSLPNHFILPSFEEFLDHFAKKAVYGYICSSFVLPMMVPTNTVKMEEYSNISDSEKSTLFMKSGGVAATEAVVDIVYHMFEKKYIQKYLQI